MVSIQLNQAHIPSKITIGGINSDLYLGPLYTQNVQTKMGQWWTVTYTGSRYGNK